METTLNNTKLATFMNVQEFLEHWQGHRMLTRRTIAAFPEEALFNHAIGGMRPFAKMVMELLGIAGPGLKEIVSGDSKPLDEDFKDVTTKAQLLKLWDIATGEVNEYFQEITEERFQEVFNLFGMYENKNYCSILYFIDNEIHHRAQGYVYLRSLGIEPPAFYER
ncbi:MAG: damage-inducible protein DinB [Cytophagaceae bacterium]|nr:damage-inducible protein DinB [Cytophagaceae bacterium]|tara:strand:- start:64 stop:558 length:495 start_codon:yes stop_codon:yes gene_type:complete